MTAHLLHLFRVLGGLGGRRIGDLVDLLGRSVLGRTVLGAVCILRLVCLLGLQKVATHLRMISPIVWPHNFAFRQHPEPEISDSDLSPSHAVELEIVGTFYWTFQKLSRKAPASQGTKDQKHRPHNE